MPVDRVGAPSAEQSTREWACNNLGSLGFTGVLFNF